MCAGVRQGGILSPVLFAVFMDMLILRLRKCGVGCKLVYGFYVAYFIQMIFYFCLHL